MTMTTAPTTRPAPVAPPARRALLWALLAFALGAISGAGVTLAIDDAPSTGAPVAAPVSDVEGRSIAGAGAAPTGSADALERTAQQRQQATVVRCTLLHTSADAAERCLSAGG